MKTISRYIMTLALLITAATGAWAEDSESITTTLPEAKTGSVEFTGTHFKITGQRADTDGMNLGSSTKRTITISALNGEIITKVEMTQSFKFYTWQWEVLSTKGNVSGEYTTGKNLTLTDVDVSEVTLSASNTTTGYLQFNKFKIFYTMPAGTMTLNTDNTEATMEMPASDVTVDYELVRDMGYKVAFSGVPTRARLAKDGDGKFHFADGLTFQLLDNIDAANPKDITSAEGITFMVGEMVPFEMEGNTYYQLDKETLVPLADFLADAHLGNYVICAVASTGEYDGSFTSGTITLFQGYEVTIPAGEYITYYRDEPLKLDDNETNAELYTISAVGTETATLSGPYDAMKALTPMLVHNKNTEEAKTILLIPCNEPDLALTVAPEFKGTLEATTIPASGETSNNYAFNGKQFVWVKNAIAVGQYKAWLEVPTGEPTAPALTLVFGDATKIETTDFTDYTDGVFYDLNGRKLQGKPTKKGVYIFNGKKVVVK